VGWLSDSGKAQRQAMMDMDKAIEAAARALCRLEGNPENTRFEGKPMWQAYAVEAKAAVEAAIPHLTGA
jgi:hypothetical protein